MRRSSRDKHSFIQFYFDDWKSATATLPRDVRSVLFEVCMYGWDKRKPMSPNTQMMMFSDLPNAAAILTALVDEGFLTADAHGSIHSPRAMREGERAYAAWEAKSRGGKQRQGTLEQDSSNSDAAMLQHSSQVSTTDSDSDSDSDSESSYDDSRASAVGRSSVVDSWNEMARQNGLKQVAQMTSERTAKLDARLYEYGPDMLIEGINLIPTIPFLLGRGENGWKATFDWLLRPDTCVGLIEGSYEPRKGQTSGPPPTPKGPSSQAEAEEHNRKLAEFGSILRWRLDGKEWKLLMPELTAKH